MIAVLGLLAAVTVAAGDPESLLARARATFRAHASRPYVTYTIEREERVAGQIVPAGTYAERVWFRRRDGAALARRIVDDVVAGPMIAERPTLDGDVDPGPPTADIFEAGAPVALATPDAARGEDLPVLAAVAVRGEFDYRVFADGSEDGALRLRLEPRRDPERNRLRELWVDPESAAVRRFTMRDRIYFAGRTSDVPGTFAFREDVADGVPSILSIASLPVDGERTGGSAGGSAGPSIRYRFSDVAFPASLPDWYFDAYVYAKHARDAPNR